MTTSRPRFASDSSNPANPQKRKSGRYRSLPGPTRHEAEIRPPTLLFYPFRGIRAKNTARQRLPSRGQEHRRRLSLLQWQGERGARRARAVAFWTWPLSPCRGVCSILARPGRPRLPGGNDECGIMNDEYSPYYYLPTSCFLAQKFKL